MISCKNKLQNVEKPVSQSRLDQLVVEPTTPLSTLTLFRSGPQNGFDLHGERLCYSGRFRFGCNIGNLFGYINTVTENSELSSSPLYIKFIFEQYLVLLHPEEAAFTTVKNYTEAIAVVKKLLTFLQEIEKKRDEIVPDLRVHSPISVVDIYRLLPKTNCRDCGYDTCLAFAAALSRQQTFFGKCKNAVKPAEERSVFKLSGDNGEETVEITLPIDTSILLEDFSNQQQQIELLQSKIDVLERGGYQAFLRKNRELDSPLTDREVEVLELVAAGQTNKQISEGLYISTHTVKTHLNHIFEKLGLHDRTKVSVWAAKNGLV